jgi:hypothetical protein
MSLVMILVVCGRRQIYGKGIAMALSFKKTD